METRSTERSRIAGAALAAFGVLALVAASGCTPATMPPPASGTFTFDLLPTVPAPGDLVITSGHLKLEQVMVLGDVTPDDRSMLDEIDLDLLQPGRSFTFSMLPQGLYSSVRFSIDHLELQGSWKGVPLQISVEPDDAVVNLRSPIGQEVGPGSSAHFSVTFDVGAWFAGNLLDSAQVASGQIAINGQTNAALAKQLMTQVLASFALDQPAASAAAAPLQ